MPLKQENRPLGIKTELADDVLALRSFSIEEELGRMFEIEAELSSEDGQIDFDKVVGRNATIRLEIGDKETRYFNGEVSRLVQVANKDGFACYRATLVPWLWFLTRTADCYIFQDMTVPEIIEDVFTTYGFNDFDVKGLSGTYSKREYCVQYRETDFNFVSRLMEQEGIYYYFKHENGKNTLMLADAISAHEPFKGYEEIVFHEVKTAGASREAVTDWSMEKEVQPVVYALQDFDFKKPKTSLLASASVTRKYGAAHFEMFDFPGEYLESSDGDRLADARINELQAQYEVLEGQANARGLSTGCTFKLKKHPRGDQNREYLITSVTLFADGGPFGSMGEGSAAEGEHFSCNFTCIDKTQQFRPERLTPKPIIQGPQTAIVVGPAGEEIYTDKYGRVKVLFHWDRYGKADQDSSCWVRVSHSLAGKGWGQIANPRIGQEVIVEFLEGDPDRPIITGRVYNAEAMPPYALPANQTMSAIKTNSSKGGSGFNEIRLEDKKGEEQIFMHGEKNLDIRIKNDAFETIGNDSHLVVGKNQIEHVKNNRGETVDADHNEKIGKDRHLNVVGKEATEIGGSQSLTVKGDVIEVFKANHNEQTTGNYYLKAENIVIEALTNITINVGDSFIAIAADGIKIKTPGDIVIEAEKKIEQKAGTKWTAEATLTAELKANLKTTIDGGLKAAVEAVKVAIESKAGMELKAGSNMELKASSNLEAKADAAMKLEASATNTIKGATVNIN
ncbi:MAG: type secretion system secreted protein VgrG [Verrucomicrobiota bacterium]